MGGWRHATKFRDSARTDPVVGQQPLRACGRGMRIVARSATEFGFVCGRGGINRMTCCRVPKPAIHKIKLVRALKVFGGKVTRPPKSGNGCSLRMYPLCIGAVACKTDVLHGRVQLRWIVGGVRIVAESARYVDGFMNVFVLRVPNTSAFQMSSEASSRVRQKAGTAGCFELSFPNSRRGSPCRGRARARAAPSETQSHERRGTKGTISWPAHVHTWKTA